VLVTGLAMFFVATGYASLNRWRAHAGAPYVWLGEAISPSVGAGTGFLNVAVSTFANVGNITLAGAYLLFALFPTHTFSKPVTWVVATAIMGVLVYFTVSHAVAGVGGFKGLAEAAVVGVALAFAVGAFVVWRASPSSPFFAEFEKRRRSGRMGDTDEEESAASQQEVDPAG
jgi:amino acid transporter